MEEGLVVEHDNKACEKRMGVDRRRFSYTFYMPERRSGIGWRKSDGNQQDKRGWMAA